MSAKYARLSQSDLVNLRLDKPNAPYHVCGLATVEGAALLDPEGHLQLDQLRQRMDRRLGRVPQLRRRLHYPGLLRGRPLWVDDQRFDIARHVFLAEVPPPGDDAQLLEVAARLHRPLLDRSKPLWELWFLTGLSGGRIGVMLKLHHAVADGMAAIGIMASLFDLEPDAPELPAANWKPERIPGGWPLLLDNLSAKADAGGRLARALAHPVVLGRTTRTFVSELVRTLQQTQAPRTSLNRPVHAGRLLRVLRVALPKAKEVAHSTGAKVNDVVLDLWAGGLRDLLIARGETVEGIELITSVAVSLRRDQQTGDLGNQVGILAVRLPVGEPNAVRRLERIAASSRKAKAEQHPAAIQSATGMLAATPIAQFFTSHQHMVNVFSTNLVGPPMPVYVLGARILDIMPIIQATGNVAISLCAFSYVDRLSLTVTADAHSFPDVDVVLAGMAATWGDLVDAAVEQPQSRELSYVR
jgi:diacylglycerol O-acyltransferase / wax synthase